MQKLKFYLKSGQIAEVECEGFKCNPENGFKGPSAEWNSGGKLMFLDITDVSLIVDATIPAADQPRGEGPR